MNALQNIQIGHKNAKPATLLGASGFETNYPSMAKSAGQI
jgi:hypothetical protein